MEFGEFGSPGAQRDTWAVDKSVDKVDKWSLRSLGVYERTYRYDYHASLLNA